MLRAFHRTTCVRSDNSDNYLSHHRPTSSIPIPTGWRVYLRWDRWKGRFLPGISCLFCLIVTGILLTPPGQAGEPSSSGKEALFATYSSIKPFLRKNQFGIPLYLRSKEQSRRQSADLYGVFDYSFTGISDALRKPPAWCEIAPLDFNIKTCTFGKVDARWHLTLYAGRKYYQPPKAAHALDFTFQEVANRSDYLDVVLHAGKGPLFTRDYLIRLEAAPIDPDRTFVHLSCVYRYGLWARLAIKAYFSTLASNKKGFSIVGADEKGKPVYVHGLRGAVERNAVRYYLALLAYMETLKYPEEIRFEKSLESWYELTERYPLQLYEMDRNEYLEIKRREHDNQLRLQIGK